jgi:YD repeat-containing protein
MSDATRTSSYSYDSLHRLVLSANGNNKTVSYVYNLRDLLTTLICSGGSAITRGYDNTGRLSSVVRGLADPYHHLRLRRRLQPDDRDVSGP